MLDRQNFRWSHQCGLASIFDGNHGSLQRDNRLAAADVALQQTVHGRAFLEIRGNFREHAFLRRGRFKRQDALQRSANVVFPHTKCNGIFLTCRAAIQREA